MIEVTNLGPDDATNVVVTDPLDPCSTFLGDDCGGTNVPPWTWSIGDLPFATAVVCNLTVDVSGCPPRPLVNTATATGDETDPEPANNEGTFVVTFDPPEPPIPTLDRIGLFLLVLVICLGALAVLRRRR